MRKLSRSPDCRPVVAIDRACVEPVERRQLLSVTLTSGVLQITGTAAADSYAVTRAGGNVVVSVNGGAGQPFAAASVTSIVAHLGGGDDSCLIDDAVAVPASLFGEAGDDTLRGGAGNDTIDGGDGDDTVTYAGRAAAVTGELTSHFVKTTDADTGVASIDVNTTGHAGSGVEADANAAVETLVGGDGADTLSLDVDLVGPIVGDEDPLPEIHRLIAGGVGDDSLSLFGAAGYFYMTPPIDLVADGGAGDDSLSYGQIYSGLLRGGDGDDVFHKLGDDYISIIEGDAGVDTFDCYDNGLVDYTMPSGLENFSGDGADVTGNDADNVIEVYTGRVDGGGGNDTISASLGDADGGDGDDTIHVTSGTIHGGAGDDVLSTSDLNESISSVFGDAGDDRITFNDVSGIDGARGFAVGGDGDDSIYGGAGDDTLSGGSGRDKIWGNGGNDRIDGGSSNDVLRAGDGDDIVDGRTGNDRLDGGLGNDALRGEDGADALYGREGNDSLDGGANDDRLDAGDGDDLLTGGTGRDILYGGTGSDAGDRDPHDRIVDEIESLA